MTDPHAAAAHAHDHAGPRLQDYLRTFYALMVLTVASYVVYVTMGHGLGAAMIILVLAVFKATLIISIFMHLWIDIGKLYGIIIPVVILCIMSTCIFLVDQVVVWRHTPEANEAATIQQRAPAGH
jgi:caa(3)-type oxidase subunit IV